MDTIHSLWATNHARLSKNTSMRALSMNEYDSEHHRSARHIFGDATFSENTPKFDDGLAIVAFTNRCGSNLLADLLLKSSAFGLISELLNHDVISSKARDLGANTFPEYIEAIRKQIGRPGKPFGVKASCTQLALLHKYNIFNMFPWTKVVHIYRNDVVAQAVSFYIASRTGRWTSKHTGNETALNYDFEQIRNRFYGLSNDNRRIFQICSALNLSKIDVAYESLVSEPHNEIARVLEFFGAKFEIQSSLKPSIERQSNDINEDYSRRFREDWLKFVRM